MRDEDEPSFTFFSSSIQRSTTDAGSSLNSSQRSQPSVKSHHLNLSTTTSASAQTSNTRPLSPQRSPTRLNFSTSTSAPQFALGARSVPGSPLGKSMQSLAFSSNESEEEATKLFEDYAGEEEEDCALRSPLLSSFDNILKLQLVPPVLSPTSMRAVMTPYADFRALLLRPFKPWSPALVPQAKLVSLNVGGQTFLTSLATLFSHPSHLQTFIQQTVHDIEILRAVQQPSAVSLLGLTPSTLSRLEAETASQRRKVSPGKAVTPHVTAADFPQLVHSARATVQSFPTAVTIDDDEDGDEDDEDGADNDTLTEDRRQVAARTPSLSSSPSTLDDRRSYFSSQPPSLVSDPSSLNILPYQHCEIFLDRNPHGYETVLYFLRSSTLPFWCVKDEGSLKEVEAEMKYLGLIRGVEVVQGALADLRERIKAKKESLKRKIPTPTPSDQRRDWI